MHDNPETHPALAGCIEAGYRCVELARLLTPEQYSQKMPGHDSIGAHMRHCLDYFTCLIEGIDTGLVDYDARRRDPRVAREPELFRRRMRSVVEDLSVKSAADPGRRLKLTQTVTSSGEVHTVETTLERELVFLSGHCVHHVAITLLLALMMGVEVSPDIGVGYSTAVHRRTASPDQ